MVPHLWTLTIAEGTPPVPVDWKARVEKRSLRGDWSRGGFAGFSFSTFDVATGAGAHRPPMDAEVVFTVDGVVRFRGLITEVGDQPLGGVRSGTRSAVRCADYSMVLERITITEAKDYTGGYGPILWSASVADDVVIPAGKIALRMHAPHGWVTGDKVRIADHTPNPGDSDINGDHVIEVPTTFTGDPAADYWIAATFFIVAPPRTAIGGAGTARKTYTVKQVVTDLVNTYLAPNYGITLDPTMGEGPVLEPLQLQGMTVKAALVEITKQTGWMDRVLPTKVLEVFPLGAKVATFSLDGSNTLAPIQWQRTRQRFANRVIVYAGGDRKLIATETVVSTGLAAAVYVMGYGASQDPNDTWPNMLIVNTEPIEPIGWGPTQLGATNWYWDYLANPARLVQQGAYVPVAGAVISATYTRQYPVKVIAEAANDVKPPPVGRGPWEDVIAAPDITDKGTAQQLANNLLAQRFSEEAPRQLQTGTAVGLAYPGDKVVLTFPDRTVTGDWYVDQLAWSFWNPTIVYYEYTFLEGAALVGNWINDFQELLGGGGGGGGSSTIITGGGSGGSGGSGGGADEVFVGPSDPGSPFELWWDTDDPTAPFGGIGSGTVGFLAKWGPTTTTLTNSLMSESGSTVLIEGSLTITGALTIPDHALTLTKLQRIPTQTVLGRSSSGADSIEVLTTLPTGVQDRITRLGTVTSGVWQASPIGLIYLAGAGTVGTFVRSTGTNWATSTLQLPNTATFSRIVFATGVNLWGESANLTFTGTALALVGDMTITGAIGSPDYASQTRGWRIDATGGADFRYLFVDEMHAKSFITDLEMALAGGQIISKSVAMVAVPFTVPAPGGQSILRVKDLPSMPDQAAFQYGDTVVLRRFARSGGTLDIADCVGQVSGWQDQADGTQTWNFVRYGGTNGGTMSGGTVPVDALALDFGISGNGYYEVSAVDGTFGANSPYAQIVTWTTAPTGAIAPLGLNKVVRARFGNLYGITSTPGEYGIIAGNYAAANGAYFRASNATFELHGITAKWWAGASNVVTIAPNNGSPYIALGNPAPTSWTSNYGIWMGYQAANGLAQFLLYSSSGHYFAFGEPTPGIGNRLWWNAGNTSLDTSGNLTAASATLSGAITATSGAIAGDFVIATGGRIHSGAVSYEAGEGWWLDYNGTTTRFRIGHPAGDRLTWDGAGVTIISHDLKIDGSAGGHVGMGGSPYILATLNVASKTNGTDTWGLVVSNASGNANFICYGDGSVYINSLIRSNPTLNHTGAGTNPPSVWNGPFGTSELDGWWNLIINGVSSWIPVWQ